MRVSLLTLGHFNCHRLSIFRANIFSVKPNLTEKTSFNTWSPQLIKMTRSPVLYAFVFTSPQPHIPNTLNPKVRSAELVMLVPMSSARPQVVSSTSLVRIMISRRNTALSLEKRVVWTQQLRWNIPVTNKWLSSTSVVRRLLSAKLRVLCGKCDIRLASHKRLAHYLATLMDGFSQWFYSTVFR